MWCSSAVQNDWQFLLRDVCSSILLHMMKFDKVFINNLIKIWKVEHSVKSLLMLVFTSVIYNVLLHRWYTTRNKFLTKLFAVIMLLYLIFATKIKLLSYFFLTPMVDLTLSVIVDFPHVCVKFTELQFVSFL